MYSTASGCTTSAQSIVIDANWIWLHTTTGYTNCYTGNTWNATLCPEGAKCAANCALNGADYSGTYSMTTTRNALKLDFVTKSSSTNVGSRKYLMAAGSTTKYQIFQLLGQEFTFDVDVSNLPYGLNGALYFSEMDGDGGMSRFPTNKADASYGTGYCDVQCPQDIKFINGVANFVGWNASSTAKVTDLTHSCSITEQTRCSGTDCGIGARYSSLCDADRCDFNSYRMGATNFYRKSLTVDTGSKFTVVTQFITNGDTTSGTRTEIRRFYVQNGVVIPNSRSTVAGVTGNSISDCFCAPQKTAFGDQNLFQTKGGLAAMGASSKKGVVLVMSIWDDHSVNMLWFDAPYPLTKDASALGVSRGTCAPDYGALAIVETASASASVTYSIIKWGPVNSTFTQSS